MPDSLAQRLDTVLAAEAARPAQVGAAQVGAAQVGAAQVGAAQVGAAQVKTDQAERGHAGRPAHPATSRGRRPRPSFRLLSARVLAPVAVVVLAAGGYGLSLVVARPGIHASASSGSAADSAGPREAAPSAAASHVDAPKSPVVRGAAGSAPQARRLIFTLVPG